jgi:general secretion pathway protein G
MLNFRIPALSCDRKSKPHRQERGATLAELLVVLVIVSTLAVVALPMAETAVQRRHEIELRETLRTVRTAIDRFHADWRGGKMKESADGISESGFPETLEILVKGVAGSEGDDLPLRYLRRVPRNPFAEGRGPISENWRLIGYEQQRDDSQWNSKDVYDLSAITERKALDGSSIKDW